MALVRNSAKSSLQELTSIMSPSFGPCGKDVLLNSDTGTIFVTSNGLSILRHLTMSHPIGTWLKNTVEKFVNKHGDYSKTFVIVLTRLFRLFYDLIVSSRNLNRDLSEISQSLMCIKSYLERDNFNDFMETNLLLLKIDAHNSLNGIYNNFISGQFNPKTCSQLYKLCEATFTHIPLSRQNLEFLVYNYDNVCISVSNVPLEQSKCVEGVIIQRQALPKKADIQQCHFVLISGKLSRTKTDGIDIQLSENISIKSREVVKIGFYYRFVELLKYHSISVIFFEESVDKNLQKILENAKIYFIQFTPEDDLCYLAKIYGITKLSGVYDVENITENAIGCTQWFRPCTLGRHSCSHLGPKDDSSKKFQIILCSLNDGLGKVYSECLLNFFKVLLMSFDDNSECLLTPACGVYEMALSRYLYTKYSNLPNCKLVADALLEIPKLIFSNSTKKTMRRLILSSDYIHGIDGVTGNIVNIGEVTLFESFNTKFLLYGTILEFCAQIFRVDKVVAINKRDCGILSKDETDSD